MELDQLVRLEQMDFASSPSMEENLTIVMNPPYGERLDPGELGSLYRMIGSTLKHHFPASNAWILSSNRQALGQVGLKPSGKITLHNGSLECLYVNYNLFKGSLKQYLTQKKHP
jgi:putative N6-adenine-specific DNA methylase